MNKIKKFEVISAIITIILGSLLHFVFEWAGEYKPLALFAAVNESTWEHLKLAFWPAAAMAIAVYFIYGKNKDKYICAQTVKLLLMPILIVVLFYGWLLFFEDSFIWDIFIFLLSVIVGHLAAYKIQLKKEKCKIRLLCLSLIGLLLISFSLFTYFPPKNLIFKDPANGGYGIE